MKQAYLFFLLVGTGIWVLGTHSSNLPNAPFILGVVLLGTGFWIAEAWDDD